MPARTKINPFQREIFDSRVSTIYRAQCPVYNQQLPSTQRNRNVTHRQEGKATVNRINPEMAWITDLANKSFKTAVTNTFKYLKKNLLKELIENIFIIREQIRNLGRGMETAIKKQMDILELKRTKSEINTRVGIMSYSV